MRLSFMETGFLYGNALRAQGLASGSVGAAVRMVQWAEIHHGIGVAYLDRRAATPLRATAPRILVDEDGCVVIDARGASSLVAGPGALDLACASASEHGFATVALHGLDDLGWLGALAATATARGFACAVSFTASPGSDDAGDLAALYSPARTVFAVPAEPAPLWIEAPQANALQAALSSGEPPGDAATALVRASRPAAAPPGASLLCLAPAAVPAEAVARAFRAWPGEPACAWEPEALAAWRRRAIVEGMEVDESAFAAVTRRALAIVVPSSEDSRHQAGADG